jgi:ketosteroid isomerase-like protein
MRRILILPLIVFALAFQGCTGTNAPVTEVTPPKSGNYPSTPEDVPSPAISQTEEPITSLDLTAFSDAWSNKDVERIRSFYTGDAVYLSDMEVVSLQRGENVSSDIADGTFSDRLKAYEGQEMKILGEPVQIFDKLVGFAFRWQDGLDGTNGVALLRYEGDKIWMHTYALSSERTPNPSPGSQVLETVNMEPLLEAWSAGDVEAVKNFYTVIDGVLAVFNDEDILKSLQGITHSAYELAGSYLASEVLTQASVWGMVSLGQSVRIGELVLMTWRFEALDYPSGYGVRFLRYDGDKIVTDIRYAIRPWEAAGQTFASGYR